MIEFHVTVSSSGQRQVLKEIVNGEFSYTPDGGQVEPDRFEFEFGAGEYAVVRDELLNRKNDALAEEGDNTDAYWDVCDAFPSTVSVSDGDLVDVSV